jgi:hypothetical protein
MVENFSVQIFNIRVRTLFCIYEYIHPPTGGGRILRLVVLISHRTWSSHSSRQPWVTGRILPTAMMNAAAAAVVVARGRSRTCAATSFVRTMRMIGFSSVHRFAKRRIEKAPASERPREPLGERPTTQLGPFFSGGDFARLVANKSPGPRLSLNSSQ